MSKYGAALTLNAREVTGRDPRKAIEALGGQRPAHHALEDLRMLRAAVPGQTNAYSLINHGATLAVVGFTMDKVEVRLST